MMIAQVFVVKATDLEMTGKTGDRKSAILFAFIREVSLNNRNPPRYFVQTQTKKYCIFARIDELMMDFPQKLHCAISLFCQNFVKRLNYVCRKPVHSLIYPLYQAFNLIFCHLVYYVIM